MTRVRSVSYLGFTASQPFLPAPRLLVLHFSRADPLRPGRRG
jgi:hypothetical protein